MRRRKLFFIVFWVFSPIGLGKFLTSMEMCEGS